MISMRRQSKLSIADRKHKAIDVTKWKKNGKNFETVAIFWNASASQQDFTTEDIPWYNQVAFTSHVGNVVQNLYIVSDMGQLSIVIRIH